MQQPNSTEMAQRKEQVTNMALLLGHDPIVSIDHADGYLSVSCRNESCGWFMEWVWEWTVPYVCGVKDEPQHYCPHEARGVAVGAVGVSCASGVSE